MKLIEIRTHKRATFNIIKKPHWWSTQYWTLAEDYKAEFVTDNGTYHLALKAGWVTDKRSGSRALDFVAPKDGSDKFQACVCAHDTSFSGFVPQPIADELFVRQGFELSDDCKHWQAEASFVVVESVGKAYDLEDEMPAPYTNNRQYESLTLEAK